MLRITIFVLRARMSKNVMFNPQVTKRRVRKIKRVRERKRFEDQKRLESLYVREHINSFDMYKPHQRTRPVLYCVTCAERTISFDLVLTFHIVLIASTICVISAVRPSRMCIPVPRSSSRNVLLQSIGSSNGLHFCSTPSQIPA